MPPRRISKRITLESYSLGPTVHPHRFRQSPLSGSFLNKFYREPDDPRRQGLGRSGRRFDSTSHAHCDLAGALFRAAKPSAMLFSTGENHMADRASQIRVLAIAPIEIQEALHRQISSFGMIPVVVTSALQLSPHIRTGEKYHVVLLPASLPNTDDWWAIWGDVGMLRPKPAILVYAHAATYQLWSGVLEAGGYDVIVEPLTDEKLMEALIRAAECPDLQ